EFMDPRGQRQNAARGADLRYDLEMSLEEAFHGKEASITIEALAKCEGCSGRGCTKAEDCARTCGTCGGAGKVRAQQGFFVVERGCPTCRGSGEVIANPCRSCEGEGRTIKRRNLSVKVPAGVDEGTRIRVSGEGEAGIRGASNGDLYIFVHMKRHAIYAREGTTLIAECPVSFTTAALGGVIGLPGLDGARIELKIPAGTQSGEQLRQRGAGMNVLNGRGRGDLVARVLVETPSRMSAKQKKLLEEFRDTETGDECPAANSFFGRIKGMFAV
ncbi:MAG: molecular chaperone DnaJ, partial [Sphingomicrobium sp.]